MKFEKVNSRDYPICLAQLIHRAYTEGFQKEFDWRYTDVVYRYAGQSMECYRPSEEHYKGMLRMGALKIRKDNNLIDNLCKQLSADSKKLFATQKEILKEDLNEKSLKDLLQLFDEFCHNFLKAGPSYGFVIFFPQDLDLNPEMKNEFIQQYNMMVDIREKLDTVFIPKSDECILALCRTALERKKISAKFARFLTLEELGKILSGSEVNIEELEHRLDRRSEHFLLTDGKLVNLLLDEYFKQRGWTVVEDKIDINQNFVKGHSANHIKGTISGRAVIVNCRAELEKVTEGDILVTPMTTPEYFYAIPKLKAIVTDEGGITCHAAIISRELNIPCIIGTKIATRVLKDGDLVEVDANKGIVRKIEG